MKLLEQLGGAKIAAIVASGIVTFISLFFLINKITEVPMSMLYNNLSMEDSNIVVSRLEGMGIKYDIGGNGSDLFVPSDKVLMVRMRLAQEGVPSAGNIVGYEIFDQNDALGTSQFVHNVNLIRALEGELSRTISSLSIIQTARVHIVMPKKELFNKGAADPSASVVLRLSGGTSLKREEIDAIAHIVSTAIPNLRTNNVTIIDNNGKPLKLGGQDSEDPVTIANQNIDYQNSVEQSLKHKLESLLEKTVGMGKVKVNVAADINFEQKVTNSELYDPEFSAVRSSKVTSDQEKENANSGAVGVAGNLPDANVQGGGDERSRASTNELTNFEVSKTITNKIAEVGKIKKLSIAILIDGSYVLEKGEIKYVPRTEEELENIKTLSVSALGVDQSRGDIIEVLNMQFSEDFAIKPKPEKAFAALQEELNNIIRIAVISIVFLLILLLVVRPLLMRSMEVQRSVEVEEGNMNAVMSSIENEVSQAKKAVAELSDQDILQLPETDKKYSLMLKQINEMVDTHPEETLAIIRNWLYGGG